MSQNLEARLVGLQPQLPLVEADPDHSGRTGYPGRTDHSVPDEEPDWHLDQRTREIGRRGIAAARAHLRNATGRAA
jgi:hypothetical protein